MSVKHRTSGLRVGGWRITREGDGGVQNMHVPLPEGVGRLTRSAAIRAICADADFPETGCNCSHCAAGWDCCGRVFLAQVSVLRIYRRRKEAVLRLSYARNI